MEMNKQAWHHTFNLTKTLNQQIHCKDKKIVIIKKQQVEFPEKNKSSTHEITDMAT